MPPKSQKKPETSPVVPSKNHLAVAKQSNETIVQKVSTAGKNDIQANHLSSTQQPSLNFMLPPANTLPLQESMEVTTSPLKVHTRKKRNISLSDYHEDDDDDITQSASETMPTKHRKPYKKQSDQVIKLLDANFKLESRVSNLEKVVKKYEILFSELSNKYDSLEVKLSAPVAAAVPKPLFNTLFDSQPTNAPRQPSNEERNIIQAIRIEQLDNESREKNILLMGVISPPESLDLAAKKDQDWRNIDKIFEKCDLNPNMIKRWTRFKKTHNSPHEPIIKVELYHRDDVYVTLRASRKLKDSTGKSNIFINPDLTPAQRHAEKTLITKRNELNKKLPSNSTTYYGIRNGVIKSITKPIQHPN